MKVGICSGCGQKKPIAHVAKNYCYRCYKTKVWRPAGGDAVERERRVNRQYKAAHQRKVQAANKRYRQQNRGECSSCGGETSERNRNGLCLKCIRERHAERWGRIRELWLDGATLAEIGEELGVAASTVAFEVSAMRKAGIEMPYRRKQVAS